MSADVETVPAASSRELIEWVQSMTEDEMRNLLYFFCGYRPALMAQFKAEASEKDGVL